MNIVDPTKSFTYASGVVPDTYKCQRCSAHGVKLWRKYHAFLDDQTLLCLRCAAKDQNKPEEFSEQIGWLCGAVPTEENDTFWSFCAVPQTGVKWWYSLPNEVINGKA